MIIPIQYQYHKIFFRNKYFIFQNKKIKYFYHPYNTTWENERSIEIPIIMSVIKKNKGKHLLEFGNVLSHYFSVKHDIIDKGEEDFGIIDFKHSNHHVIDKDIIQYNTKNKYDLIVSISTLEHVGQEEWDSNESSSNKIIEAIENLKKLVKLNGKIVITIPVGYNKYLDEYIQKGTIKFDKLVAFKQAFFRVWEETIYDEIKTCRYGYPFHAANGLLIGIIEKK